MSLPPVLAVEAAGLTDGELWRSLLAIVVVFGLLGGARLGGAPRPPRASSPVSRRTSASRRRCRSASGAR